MKLPNVFNSFKKLRVIGYEVENNIFKHKFEIETFQISHWKYYRTKWKFQEERSFVKSVNKPENIR